MTAIGDNFVGIRKIRNKFSGICIRETFGGVDQASGITGNDKLLVPVLGDKLACIGYNLFEINTNHQITQRFQGEITDLSDIPAEQNIGLTFSVGPCNRTFCLETIFQSGIQ